MEIKIKTVLVDDERKSREVIRILLERHCPGVYVCGEAANVEDAFRLQQELRPELVFLDIEMPSGDGFSLLKKYDVLPFEVVFITGFDTYALSAIKASALDYLLKPVEAEELVLAVKKAMDKIQLRKKAETAESTLHANSDQENTGKKMAIHNNDKVIFINISSICTIESDDRYSHITTITNEKYMVTKTLKECEQLLMDNAAFIRVSKTTILNVNFVHDYSKGEPCFIKMENGNVFEISRRKKKDVLDKLRAVK